MITRVDTRGREQSRAEERSSRDGDFEAVRFLVVRKLRARYAEIDQAIYAHVREAVPDQAGSTDTEYMEGLRTAVTAGVEYVLTGLEAGTEPTKSVPAEVVAQARRAARAGVGLDTVLRRYVAGHALLGDFVMQELDHDDIADQRIALRRVLGTSASLLDRLIPPIASAYSEALTQAGRVRPSRDAVAALNPAPAHGQATRSQQRARILGAVVEIVSDRGFASASVGQVIARAKVSRRTFYECFGGLEDCMVAVMDCAFERVGVLAAQALASEELWQDSLRAAIATVLTFFDAELALARVCVVESLAAGTVVLEHRERVVRAFRSLIMARIESELPYVAPLAGESALASVMGMVHTRLTAQEPEPLIALLGPLMGTIITPFVADEQTAAKEIRRGEALARTIQASSPSRTPPSGAGVLALSGEQDEALPAILANPSARRARECLRFLAEHPDASNREVAAGIGVTHQSQISKLLSYLIREDLVFKRSEGPGKRNAWRLTSRGEELAKTLSEQRSQPAGAP